MNNLLAKMRTHISFQPPNPAEPASFRFRSSSFIQRCACALHFGAISVALASSGQAAVLVASDGTPGKGLGYSGSVSGESSLVGAVDNTVYLYRNLATASGTVSQSAKLLASDLSGLEGFGFTVGISGNIGVAGAPNATVGGRRTQGAAYLFRNQDAASGTITQAAKLLASNGQAEDFLGANVSVSGTVAAIGAANFSSSTGGRCTCSAIWTPRPGP